MTRLFYKPNSLYHAARFQTSNGFFCSVNHLSGGEVNVNHSATHLPSLARKNKTENDSRPRRHDVQSTCSALGSLKNRDRAASFRVGGLKKNAHLHIFSVVAIGSENSPSLNWNIIDCYVLLLISTFNYYNAAVNCNPDPPNLGE